MLHAAILSQAQREQQISREKVFVFYLGKSINTHCKNTPLHVKLKMFGIFA